MIAEFASTSLAWIAAAKASPYGALWHMEQEAVALMTTEGQAPHEHAIVPHSEKNKAPVKLSLYYGSSGQVSTLPSI